MVKCTKAEFLDPFGFPSDLLTDALCEGEHKLIEQAIQAELLSLTRYRSGLIALPGR